MVRGSLENGRYNPKGKLISVHYLEQKIVEFKELTPAIPERLLVQKLSKHFGQNIQIAAINNVTNWLMYCQNMNTLRKEHFRVKLKVEAHKSNIEKRDDNGKREEVKESETKRCSEPNKHSWQKRDSKGSGK